MTLIAGVKISVFVFTNSGLSVEMVNQDIQTSILSSRGDSDDEGRRRSFHLLETAGNLTVWNLTFTLGVQNTTKFQGANVTVSNARFSAL